MPYSAGTAFLQVVPSFRNVEKAMRKQAAEIGREMDRSVSRALPRGMAEGSRNANREGRRAGDDYSGALSRAIRRNVKRSYEQLPELEINADSSDADKAIARIRSELKEIHDQHVNVQIDDATALQALRRLDSQLEQINRSAATVSVHANTAAARRELRQVEDLANGFGGRRTERHVDDQFSRELIRAARAAERDLPEISLRFDEQGLAQEVAEIRAILKSIGDDETIGIDIDDDEAIRKLREAEARLKVLHELGEQDIRLEADTGAALAKIEAFFKAVQARRLAAEREARAEAERARRDQQRIDDRAAADAARRAARVQANQLREEARDRARAEREAQLQAERDMGSFARRFRDEMRGAANSIRRVTVDADTSASQRKLQALREEIVKLGDAHIGVDLDAAEARTKIREIRAELQQLARKTPDIQVRADIAAAYAKLRLLERLADHLDGRRIDLNVDLDNAARGINNIGAASNTTISRLGVLIAAIVGLGPALIPIAAGATVLLGSIATAAAGAAVGVGAVALALFGIGDAVKALGEYQKDTAKSAKSLSQSENQIANAVDGVAGSERSLQAARESAAASAKRSAQAVAAARRAVTDAEKEAARAQLALADAIKEVQQQEEDRELQLRDLSLAQRKATLDLKESKKELDRILRNPRATEDEREQARISYEERVLQIDQLSSAQQRLQAEQDEATRKGVMGADQVVAAQERIADSQQAVADANQSLANAVADQRQQQRDSARAILSAQEALEQSQRTLRQAYVSSGVAGGEALQTLQEKMDALSPAGQRFARFIFGLKDEFLDLRNAAAEGFLPGAQAAITALLPYLPRLRDFLGEVSTAMGDIAVRITTAFGNVGWQRFFAFIGETAVPSLNGLATATGNLIEGTRDLLIALSAFNRPIGKGFIDMTEAYARWAFQLNSSDGYRKFLGYVKAVGPDVLAFFTNLGEAIWDILVAGAPVGKIVLGLVDGFLRLISAIPTPALTILITVIAALGVGYLLLGAAMKISTVRTTVLEAAQRQVVRTATFTAAAMDRLTMANVRNAVSMSTLHTGWAAARTAAGNFASGMTSVAGVVGTTGRAAVGFASFLTGPWGLALLGASIAVGLLFGGMKSGEEQTKANVDALRKLGEEVKRTGSIQSSSVKEMIQDNKELKNLVLNINDLANVAGRFNEQLAETNQLSPEVSWELQRRAASAYATDLDTLAKALTGNQQAQEQLDAVLKDVAENGQDATQKQYAKDRREELQKLYAQQKLNAAVERELSNAAKGTGAAFDDAKPGLQEYVESLKTLADASSTAADKADALRRADEALFGTQRDLQESIEAQARALRERNELLDDENFLRKTGAKELDVTTEAGAKLTDVIEAELEAINATFRANIANGVSVEEATKKHDDEIAALRKKTQDKKLDQTATEHLIAVYGQVPTSRITEFATKEFGTTMNQLNELMVYQYALREGVSLETARARLNPIVQTGGVKGNSQGAGLATGGPVIGPGDKTSDSVQAWIPKTGTPIALSDGEWVHKASAVDYYGTGLMRALNEKRIPRELLGMIGYAGGGLLGALKRVREDKYPFPYNTSTTKIPSKDEVGRAVQKTRGYDSGPGGAGPGFLPWPSSPGAQRGDTGVWRSILNLVRASGIPFNFGNAYRPGDPLWHGSGRAVDFMGYNQDELANFFLQRQSQLLELIHLTPKGGYFVTRGQRKKNFAVQGPLHRNHLHVAMATGGLVGTPPQLTTATYDGGGPLAPGYTLAYNGTGQTEQVLTSRQMADMALMAKQAAAQGNAYHFQFRDTTLDAGKLRAIQNREAALARVGRAR